MDIKITKGIAIAYMLLSVLLFFCLNIVNDVLLHNKTEFSSGTLISYLISSVLLGLFMLFLLIKFYNKKSVKKKI